jgi:hypothetical protein
MHCKTLFHYWLSIVLLMFNYSQKMYQGKYQSKLKTKTQSTRLSNVLAEKSSGHMLRKRGEGRAPKNGDACLPGPENTVDMEMVKVTGRVCLGFPCSISRNSTTTPTDLMKGPLRLYRKITVDGKSGHRGTLVLFHGWTPENIAANHKSGNAEKHFSKYFQN